MGSDSKPTIVCMGILNIKGDEAKYLAGEIRKKGADVKIMDIGLGAESPWADIPLSDVLAADQVAKDDVFKATRAEAVDLVGRAGAKRIMELYHKGEVDGVIAWAGSVGTSVATRIMRALPIGFPKIMMCTLAAGDVGHWLGNKDIYIVNPISEKGINRVTDQIVNNAASAIVAMARAASAPSDRHRPLVALTAYGTTTPTVLKCAEHMERRGWDTIIIHQVGTGATMEDLIRAGQITAVYDITTGELSNNMFGSIYGISKDWEGERLTAASAVGAPQIVCPGGLAQCAWGPVETMPQAFLDEYEAGARKSHQNSGKPYVHNEAVSIVTPTLDETKTLALEVITKLNHATGPTALVLPMRGWSAYDQSADLATVERGWAKEKGDGPVWWPDPDKPNWSIRATTMWRVFVDNIDRGNVNLDLIRCDMHLLDDAFIALLNTCMSDMLDKKWRRGMYRDMTGVLSD
ncbi:MAG: hypothetical protein GY798_02155 [Hyphomicrobiales bacterium]|nr:hypothetical protein [Hyphomicrobiales bacterium]